MTAGVISPPIRIYVGIVYGAVNVTLFPLLGIAPQSTALRGAWINPQWIVGASGLIEDTSTDQFGTGIPIDRSGEGLVPVGHLDGSTAAVRLADLSADMRMWNPRGVGPLGLTPAN